MSLLAQNFREETKKFKDPAMSSEVDLPIGYPTTFLPLDFINGMYVENQIMDNSVKYNNYSIGMGDGSIVMVIGKTGSAKTTFAIQAATSIVAPFKNSVIIHEDLERGTTKPRVSVIAGWNMGMIEQRYILRQSGITAETFFTRVMLHCNNKIKLAEQYPEEMTYDTGLFDVYGKKIRKVIPSVMILDSLPLLMPGDLTEDEKLSGQMSTTAQAKTNARIFRTIAPKINQANVILFVINHINQNININPFAPKQAQINYLKQDETLPGGHMAMYLSNNIIKFVTSDKLNSEKEFGINGFYSKVQLIKSRSNRAGQEVRLVFNQNTGFDRVLSNYVFLKDNGGVHGSGAWFYLDGCPDMKFNQKQFTEKFFNEPKLRYAMRNLVTEIGQSMIPRKAGDEMGVDSLMENLLMSYT